MRRFAAWWVALAVILSGATQLRLGALPIGPGEALLSCWVLFMAMLLLGGRVLVGPVTRILCLYWLAAATLLGFGAVMAIGMDLADTAGDSRAHDVLAYALLAAFSLSLASMAGQERRVLPQRSARDLLRVHRVPYVAPVLSGNRTVRRTGALLVRLSIRWLGGESQSGFASRPRHALLRVVPGA